MLGVKGSTAIRWERGESEPVPWIRAKLAKALRVSPDRLMDADKVRAKLEDTDGALVMADDAVIGFGTPRG